MTKTTNPAPRANAGTGPLRMPSAVGSSDNFSQNALGSKFRRIDFQRIGDTALGNAPWIVQRLLPHGRRFGHEWVALNPNRADKHLGSFKINLASGKWKDFAIQSASGSDLISLAAYVLRSSPREAALCLAQMLSIEPWEA